MKKIIFCGAAILLGGMLYAQKAITVPAAVKTAFTKTFPNAKSVKWSKETATEFEAEFTNSGVKQAANFSSTGAWVVTETEVKKAELPAPVTAAVQKAFAGYKMDEIEKVEMPGKPMYYEMKVEKGEKSFVVEVSPEGKILKKEVEKEEKEGKEEKDGKN